MASGLLFQHHWASFFVFYFHLTRRQYLPLFWFWAVLWHSFELTFPKQSFCNQSRQKQQHDHHSRPPFVQDWQPVLVCNFHRKPHWVPATIVKAVGPVSIQTDTGLVLPVVPWKFSQTPSFQILTTQFKQTAKSQFKPETRPSIKTIFRKGLARFN